jgi:hypothetical protein
VAEKPLQPEAGHSGGGANSEIDPCLTKSGAFSCSRVEIHKKPTVSPYSASHGGEIIFGDIPMRFRREPLFSILLDAGLNLLDSLRDRLPGNVDDLKERIGNTYDTASDRVSRATAALRGEEDSQVLGKGIALLIGVGIGVGIGVLIAPASGEETRDHIANKVSEVSDKVRERVGNPQDAAGTRGGE